MNGFAVNTDRSGGSFAVGGIRMAQPPMCPTEIGQVEAVVAADADMGFDER
jgi:hypothetical protein